MLTPEIVKSLKQTNVSADSEATSLRVKQAIKAANAEQKAEIESLAGLKKVSISRVYLKGKISAKIAVAIAQTLNIDPFYLTGEADVAGECSDELLASFLNAKGYGAVAKKAIKPPRKPRRKKAAAVIAESIAQAEAEEEAAPVEIAPEEIEIVIPPAPDVTEDEAIQLLHSLFTRAKYSGDAARTLDRVKLLLL